MPLKITRREGSQAWWITGTVKGSRIRESTGIADRALAEEAFAVRSAEIYRAAIHGEPKRAADWSFAEAVTAYLADRPRSKTTKTRVKRLMLHFGPGTPCAALSQRVLEDAATALLRPDHTPGTRLREIIGPARAVLRFAAERDGCPQPHLRVRVPASNRTEWLTPRQGEAIERAIKPHLRPLVVFLLGTGARLGEALRLQWIDVNLDLCRATLRKTKNKLDRHVDLCPRVVAALAGIDGREDQVFRTEDGTPFRDTRDKPGGGQIKSPWNRAAEKAGLPGARAVIQRKDRPSSAGIFMPIHTPHSARHSWATWHYATHKDLLLLKRDGGWSSVTLVERYAHLAPKAIAAQSEAWRNGPTLVTAGTILPQNADPEKKTA